MPCLTFSSIAPRRTALDVHKRSIVPRRSRGSARRRPNWSGSRTPRRTSGASSSASAGRGPDNLPRGQPLRLRALPAAGRDRRSLRRRRPLAPPRQPGRRVKTDRRDAKKLLSSFTAPARSRSTVPDMTSGGASRPRALPGGGPRRRPTPGPATGSKEPAASLKTRIFAGMKSWTKAHQAWGAPAAPRGDANARRVPGTTCFTSAPRCPAARRSRRSRSPAPSHGPTRCAVLLAAASAS